jgi:hypothetical protein
MHELSGVLVTNTTHLIALQMHAHGIWLNDQVVQFALAQA